MNRYFPHQTPWLIQLLFPNFTWRRATTNEVIYITFDDGPVPEATPYVLNCLQEFQAKATFFCVGANVSRYPELYQRLISEGHTVGNHTYHHLNGWKTPNRQFFEDVIKCHEVLRPSRDTAYKPLLRPPYGKLKRGQWIPLAKEFEIVMWDVLSGDYSNNVDADSCLEKTIRYTKPGSIVLFHDSIKTIDKLKLVLPAFLEHFHSRGFRFQAL